MTNNISSCITATIIQDSISEDNIRITTFELEYPRFIHSELMTHRQFSRNAASSRAVPVSFMHTTLTAQPIYWGRAKTGMGAVEEINLEDKNIGIHTWDQAKTSAIKYANILANELNVAKEITNRITEPFMMMKTIITATEYTNWFYLRDNHQAQPEIQELARRMRMAMSDSTPTVLHPGMWHVPYVTRKVINGAMYYFSEGSQLSLEQAKIISSSCCAQVSYRRNDDSLEKAYAVYDRLIKSKPVHSSPIEHQATPMLKIYCDGNNKYWESGVTHMDSNSILWSGNFKGWIQMRKIFEISNVDPVKYAKYLIKDTHR